MNSIGDIIGKICKAVLPIDEEYYVGNPDSSTAVCTLGSISLLKELKDSDILQNVAIVGRLFSENKGIDSIVRYVNQNNIQRIILCGNDVWGHKAGHSLTKLHENGIDDSKRIIDSISPDPFLTVTASEIKYFQNNVELVNMIGETSLQKILTKV